MNVAVAPAAGVAAAATLDERQVNEVGAAARTQPDLRRFVGLMAQLGVLLAVFYVYDIEEPAFGLLSLLVVGGFAIHYWLPLAWKETFYIAWSLASAFVMLPPAAAATLIGAGLLLFGVVAMPIAFRWRLVVIAALTAAAVYARATHGFGIPYEFWPVFGAMFMFRFVIYLYDAAHARTTPTLREFLTYFFIVPNYYFLLFPVIDFQTHRQAYFRRPIHEVAQQGVLWIARGTVHLLLYRLIYQWKGPSNAPDQVTTFASLASTMVLTYLLYLRVSGQFHIIVGFLHLFGYDLPETHRRYLLARSLTDFWRRINIYWKDFMVKVVYFPVFFRFRRGGQVRAQVIATAAVFVVTWLLHAYQWFWLRGELLLSWPDALFWGILGSLVTVNLLLEGRRQRRAPSPWRARLEPLRVAGTFCLVVTMWSLWNSPSVTEWIDLVTWWKVG
jgi:D-alanyl-lipoteichoic acid acyltransferase DltB (MBOAT superfamily)